MPQLISFFGAVLSCTIEYCSSYIQIHSRDNGWNLVMYSELSSFGCWMLWLESVLLITVRLHESSLLVEWWRNPHRERPQWFPRQSLSWEYPSYLVNIHPTSRSTVHLITVTKLQLMHVTSSEPEKAFTGGAERGRTVWALCYKSKKSNGHPCSKHSSKQLWIQLNGS